MNYFFTKYTLHCISILCNTSILIACFACLLALGNLIKSHRDTFLRNPLFMGMRPPDVKQVDPLEKRFNKISSDALDMLRVCKS